MPPTDPSSNPYFDRIVADLTLSRDVLDRTLADRTFLDDVGWAAAIVTKALADGHKVMLAGNGGSAADAQHLAGELVARFRFDRAALPGLALTTDTSVLTAIGNDYGYEQVFSRQISAFGRAGDVFIAFSTSGRSPNILAACRVAKAAGIATIGFTGASGGLIADLCDVVLKVPSDSTPLIQQIHITVGHVICSIAEDALFGQSR